MTDSARNETIEERLARVETKTDLVRQDLSEFRDETRSGFSAVRADMREMEVRLCRRRDEPTAKPCVELKDTPNSLGNEFQNPTDDLSVSLAETRDYLKGLTVTIMSLSLAALGLVILLILRG